MTEADRIRVREARNVEQRRLVDEARGIPRRTHTRKSPVVRAAEKAHRAQDAVEIVKTLVPDVVRVASGRCQFCAMPVKDGDVCRNHADLLEAGL